MKLIIALPCQTKLSASLFKDNWPLSRQQFVEKLWAACLIMCNDGIYFYAAISECFSMNASLNVSKRYLLS